VIVLLGGTQEGRRLTRELAELGFELLVSTATSFGAGLIDGGVQVRHGPLDAPALEALINERKVEAVVDATHPFAQEISAMAEEVCGRLSLPYLRYERAAAELPDDGALLVADSVEAAAGALAGGRKIFLSTGARTIGRFTALGADAGLEAEFFARILPARASIEEALRWLPAANIVAAVGPFDREFDLACWRRFAVDTLVTKNSGAGVGLEQKVAGALEMGLRVVVIDRPPVRPGAFYDPREIALALGRRG
jgi:precorrin-6A/cobalt-precorrin-6A reductase